MDREPKTFHGCITRVALIALIPGSGALTASAFAADSANPVTPAVPAADTAASGTDSTASGTDSTASGTDSAASGTDTTPSPFAPADETPFRLMANIGAGVGFASGSGYATTSSGPQLMAGALLSYVARQWVFDAGLNWLYSELSGSTTTPNQSADVRTRAGMAEVSPRYRLGDRWQLGPVVDILYGTDTAFGPSVVGSSTNVFVGAKLAYEMPVGDFAIRPFLQALTDVSIAGRQVTVVDAGLQFGLPFGLGAPRESEVIHTSAAAPALTEESLSAPADMAVELEPTLVFFSTDSAEIRPEAEAILERVGSYLASHPDDWRDVELSGHADQRGPYMYNLKLSGSRAIAVLAALSRKGADVSKISIHAFSWLKPSDPHNNRTAWARNRRVVILFREAARPEILQEMLKPLTKGEGYGPEVE